MMYVRRKPNRKGAAAVELAFLLPLLLTLIVGVWELGRLIQVQQIMNNAARAGARLASQANIINTTGAYTQITVSSSSPSITDVITQNLKGAGITNLTGLDIKFAFITGDTSLTDPYQGVKNQRFTVSVTLPFSNVSFSTLKLINPTTVGGSCTWQIMLDDPITVSTSLPAWDPVNN